MSKFKENYLYYCTDGEFYIVKRRTCPAGNLSDFLMCRSITDRTSSDKIFCISITNNDCAFMYSHPYPHELLDLGQASKIPKIHDYQIFDNKGILYEITKNQLKKAVKDFEFYFDNIGAQEPPLSWPYREFSRRFNTPDKTTYSVKPHGYSVKIDGGVLDFNVLTEAYEKGAELYDRAYGKPPCVEHKWCDTGLNKDWCTVCDTERVWNGAEREWEIKLQS